MREIRDEYLKTYDPETETVYGGGIDVFNNRAYIDVDAETLSRKTNVPDSPLVFELGSPWIIDLDNEEDNDSCADDLSVCDVSDIDPIDEEDISGTVDSFTKANQATINIKGGQKLKVYKEDGRTGVGMISAGIGCTTRSGKRGLVVNGHDMKIGYRVFLDKTEIGQVTFVQYKTDEKGDYCIITLADNVTADGATYCYMEGIYSVVRQNHSVYEPRMGDELFKCTEARKFASFIVNDLHYKTQYAEVQPIEMVKAKIISGVAGKGDSGTGIYHNASDDPASFLEFSGIQSGCGGDDPVTKNPTYIIFTPPKYIKNCTIVCT